MPKIHYIVTGGTFADVAPHFAVAAPAFGRVGRELTPLLASALASHGRGEERVVLIRTRMAVGGGERSEDELAALADAGLDDLRSNADIIALLERIVARPDTKSVVMAAAACDFTPSAISPSYGAAIGKGTHPRLPSAVPHVLALEPAEKAIATVRRTRKDVFLVGFKTTAGAAADEQYLRGLALLKRSSCNLVLANDVRTGRNMVITPEQARYHETDDRTEALAGLADMIAFRSALTFTRATVVPGDPVPWTSPLVPATLRAVVDHCVSRGAYKPFLGSTVGHFAVKVDASTILTSRRKTDFNRLDEVGLVLIEAAGPDAVIAHGSKPSVGGQSQRIIFAEHPDVDCIVHFHCPRKPASKVPVRSQREFECGSHECGKNTSDGLGRFGGVLAVMLDRHGPNVVFSRDADPKEVIAFIEANFDLEERTDEVEADEPALDFFRFAATPAYA